MTTAKTEAKGFRFPIFQGLLPIKASQVPTEVIAGITLSNSQCVAEIGNAERYGRVRKRD